MAYQSLIYEEMFDVESQTAQTTQNIWNFIVGNSNVETLDSNL